MVVQWQRLASTIGSNVITNVRAKNILFVNYLF